MTALEQISGPGVEPLMLDEVKVALKIEQDDEDALLARLVSVARQRCEQFTGRALNTQQWRLTLDRWPGTVVALPMPPLLSVEAVTTYSANGEAVSVPADAYGVDTAGTPGHLILKAVSAWPAPGRDYNGIEITFQAGYGSSWNDVPEALRQGMLLLVASLYEDREGMPVGLPPSVAGLWSAYRLVRL